jgi:pimeloyl-ACP methyl ester carboxylesterase
VITSVINTINQHRQPGQEVILSGYSGGATIAVGAALQLEKVRGLVTVAGNLNVHGLNDYHQVQFMPEAFDPSQHITDLMHIPQRHYIGLDDAVVPPHLSEQFAQQLPLAEMVKLPDVSHTQGWFKQTIDFTFN